MQPRETRYWLRIESGERQGEKLPLAEGTHHLGRQSDNSVVLSDPSVSGRHAELQVAAEGLRIIDLGSTNGVLIDGRKIEEMRLAHGDRLSLGNIAVVVMDAALGDDGPAASAESGVTLASAAALGAAGGDGRGRRGVLLGLTGAALLFAGGVFAWREWRPREHVQARVAVAPVPGNLLDDPSFEGEGAQSASWEPMSRAPQSLVRDVSFARSGSLGLGVELDAGAWALSRSPSFELRARRSLVGRAFVSSDGQTQARFGIELASSAAALPSFVAWGPPLASSEGFQELELIFDTPPGFDLARVVLGARGAGRAAIDDVSVVQGDATRNAAASFLEYEVQLFGEPASRAALVRGGRVLLSDIGLDAWSASRLNGQPAGTWSVRASETGLRFDAHDAGAKSVLRFTVVPAGGQEQSAADEVLFATIGPDGYRSHSSTFEVQRATDLILGGGLGPMRVALSEAVSVRATTVDGAPRLEIAIGELGGFDLQLRFREERMAALALEAAAEAAQSAGDAGGALEAWGELLDEHPFDPGLVRKAENARAGVGAPRAGGDRGRGA